VTAQAGERRASGRNLGTGLMLAGLVAGMVGLAFASVPLYRLFCQVTGYGGTTQVAEEAPGAVGERVITVRFNADVDPDLPWRFQPVARAVEVRVGEQGLAFYRAFNESDRPVSGTAVFNVTPQKAGAYFNKVACFCFDEQRLEPGQTVDMGVSFFIDPAILDDRNLDEVKTVTLSYTFFRSPGDEDEPEASPAARQVTQRHLADEPPATGLN
jgi:cytochrome c oxidase assembly protein subunit 11